MTASSHLSRHAGPQAADRSALWLAGVVLLHAGLLAGAMFWPGQPQMPAPPITPPAVVGVLVPLQSAAQPSRPQPPQPQPQPQPPKPQAAKPKPQPRPAPAPLPKTPSERAPTVAAAPAAPAKEQQAAAPAADAAAAATKPAASSADAAPAKPAPAAESAPVTPPRSDASALNSQAAYPPLSRRLREQGRVLLDVYILADGSVGELKLRQSSGFARLDEAALDAVRRWRYAPARRGNEPIPYWYVQPVAFALDR
jgi:protein TonB